VFGDVRTRKFCGRGAFYIVAPPPLVRVESVNSHCASIQDNMSGIKSDQAQ
jgi:hypothetical protein